MELGSMAVDKNERFYILAKNAYYFFIATCLGVIALFTYMTWYFFNITSGTSAQKFTILIALPILIGAILLFMLLITGKKATAHEIITFLGKT